MEEVVNYVTLVAYDLDQRLIGGIFKIFLIIVD